MKKTDKKVNLVCQAKGGVGKSFFIYLAYQKMKEDENTSFIDLDNANQTTLKRLPANKVKSFDVLDARKKINREAFLSLFETVSGSSKISNFFVDMGATESIEFLNMMTQNFSPADLKSEFDSLNLEIVFNVVISGGDVYVACVKFLDELIATVNTLFTVNIWVNMGRFNAVNDKDYLDTLATYQGKPGIGSVRNFGSTDTEESDANLIELIKNGTEIDPAKLNLATRMKYRKLLSEIEF
jgi:hypothetical protein